MLSHFQVLHGGENLLDKVEQLKQRSAQTKTQLDVARRRQEEQQRRLEKLQVERLDISAQYSSLEVRRGGMLVVHCSSRAKVIYGGSNFVALMDPWQVLIACWPLT